MGIFRSSIPVSYTHLDVYKRQVQQLAGDVKEWKHTTIATFLQKLYQKGLLRVVKKGNTNLYYPLVTEEEYLRFETIDVYKRQRSDGAVLCSGEYNAYRL